MSQLFASGGQSIGVSASTSVLPMNTQNGSLGWTGWISLKSKQRSTGCQLLHSIRLPLCTSVQSLIVSDSLRPHGLQHARLLCLLLSPGVCSDSCQLNQWCYLSISSSAVLLSFCLQSFSTSGSVPLNQLFTSSGQSIGTSASVLPVTI